MSNKSTCNRRDFLALGALAATAISKNASANPIFAAFMLDSSLPVGFCPLGAERLQSAHNVHAKDLGPSVKVTIDGNADDIKLEDVELSISYPKASSFKAWSHGGYPLASTSSATSFIVPQRSTNGLKLTLRVQKSGKIQKHKILIGEKATEKGLREGHYALLLEESNPNWRKLSLQNLPAHILLTVERA